MSDAKQIDRGAAAW